MRLVLPRPVLADILAHAREGAPLEVCGMLAGARSADAIEVARHWRVANVHPRPVGEYLLDPKEQLRITLDAEDRLGLEVVGFYHSHPAGPPRLSATDAARATWPGAAYVLAWLSPPEGWGAWTWDAGKRRFEALETTVADGALDALKAMGPFLLDVAHGRVHRSEAMTEACAGEIDPERVQVAGDVLRASMALKTRHYLPCTRCWGPKGQSPNG